MLNFFRNLNILLEIVSISLKVSVILNQYNTLIDTKNIDKVSIPQVSKTPLSNGGLSN
jgi:hypothetical protein